MIKGFPVGLSKLPILGLLYIESKNITSVHFFLSWLHAMRRGVAMAFAHLLKLRVLFTWRRDCFHHSASDL